MAVAAALLWREMQTPRLSLPASLTARTGDFSDREQTRKELLLKAAETECTAIGETGFYVGGEMVAKNLAQLRSCGVTHVSNAAGLTVPDYHAGTLQYLTFHMTDGGARYVRGCCLARSTLLPPPRLIEVRSPAVVHDAGAARTRTAVRTFALFCRHSASGPTMSSVGVGGGFWCTARAASAARAPW